MVVASLRSLSSAPSTKTWKTKYKSFNILGSILFWSAAVKRLVGIAKEAGSKWPGLGRLAGGLSREKLFLPPPPTRGYEGPRPVPIEYEGDPPQG